MRNEIKRLSPKQREDKGRAINNLNGKSLGKELGFNIVQYGRNKPIDTEINVGDLVLISQDNYQRNNKRNDKRNKNKRSKNNKRNKKDNFIANPLKSDLTGTVTEKGNKYIKVAIENLPKWAKKRGIRIDLYASDISFRRMEDNLKNLSENGENALKLIIKKEEKNQKINNSNEDKQSKNKDIESKNTQLIDSLLNKSQKIAISKAKESKDFFLIHGPFGTGKTRTLLELIKEEAYSGNKVLATAESNTAVDNLLSGLTKDENIEKYSEDKLKPQLNYTRLGHPQRVSNDNIIYSLAYKAENHEMNEQKIGILEDIDRLIEEREEFTKPSPRYRRGFSDSEIIANGKKKISSRGVPSKVMISMGKWLELNNKINEKYDHLDSIDNEIIKDILNKTDVVISTNSSAALEYIQNIKFDIAIIDEASQTTIPSVLIPIAKSKKFILAGDHKQLPPTVTSSKCNELTNTLFEKLIKKYPEKSAILTVQYRMNEKLMEFPNKEFYNNQLETEAFISNITLRDIPRNFNKNKAKDNEENEKNNNLNNSKSDKKEILDHFKNIEKYLNNNDEVFLFIDTKNYKKATEEHLKDSKSIRNKTEAEIVQLIIENYTNAGFSEENIGVISPYYDQVDYLKSRIRSEVKTVDGFQGREKEIIILSTVRSNDENKIGFLSDLRRLNVAITRGKRKLIIIGNSQTLSSNKTYERLINYLRYNNSIIAI